MSIFGAVNTSCAQSRLTFSNYGSMGAHCAVARHLVLGYIFALRFCALIRLPKKKTLQSADRAAQQMSQMRHLICAFIEHFYALNGHLAFEQDYPNKVTKC